MDATVKEDTVGLLRNCLNLYCENVYSVFLSETTNRFAAIVELTTARNGEEVAAKKTHKQISR